MPTPKLTTITPYWGRPKQLAIWIESLRYSALTEVEHWLYCVGPQPPDMDLPSNFKVIPCLEAPGQSIGHYHNRGAKEATSEWIMKLDIDCVAHVGLFTILLAYLDMARPREWFNVGMFYVNQTGTDQYLTEAALPMTPPVYEMVRDCCCLPFPAGTNFVCRREEYLALGGCDERFRGYGWEDYQQIHMLEKHQLGRSPLAGEVTLANVTQRCRDEISRPKALQLYQENKWLALLHGWHPTARKEPVQMARNKAVLFEHIK